MTKFSRAEPEDAYVPEPWKELLEPFADLHWRMEQLLHAMSDERLAELLAACDKPEATNCWFATYNAANWIKPEIEKQQKIRAHEPATRR